jgi:centrosomal protein CEP120
LNLLNLEKIELERKLTDTTKAKNHYKEQWARALQEIAKIKKKEEENAKAMLTKQQMELEHLRLRYLAAEEKDFLKSDEKQLNSLRNEIEKMKMCCSSIGSGGGVRSELRSTSELDLRYATSSSNMDNQRLNNLTSSSNHNLNDHVKRLVEERDTLLRTGVYSDSDAIIIELDKRINESLINNR